MAQKPSQRFVTICLFLFTTFSYAYPTDDEVAKWTSEVLLKTITVDYTQLEDHSKSQSVRKYYSGQAWSGMNDFFSGIIPLIMKYKAKTNPHPEGPPAITEKGLFNGVPYWQVTQSFNFPKVNKYVWFSVIVVPNDDPKLKIQSLDMKTNFIMPVQL